MALTLASVICFVLYFLAKVSNSLALNLAITMIRRLRAHRNFKGLACSSNTLRFHLVIKIILQFNQTKLWLSRATEKQKKLAPNKRGFDDLWLVQSSSYAASRSDGRCWGRFITAAEVWAGAAAVMKAQDNSVHHCHLRTLRRMNTFCKMCDDLRKHRRHSDVS